MQLFLLLQRLEHTATVLLTSYSLVTVLTSAVCSCMEYLPKALAVSWWGGGKEGGKCLKVICV